MALPKPKAAILHLYPGERDQCLCKLIVRAGLSGATNYAPVPRAPVSGRARSVPV